ncbi:type VI secretion system protein ImpK [Rhodobacter aestuarii]|uniref:Type VI secretion system protein ImpK n=1 Tax=Rhodobacter aestuarii TaxID=453582 RepID=A0A1N7JX56_9RHOB|nr:type VI secretion system protein TssL, long form [Rhodobacter aestuarii]PTV95954.1 type VI secretion system protein ImpK [Rhodobacter aestuarii]SIS53826.1 type VI secretion system protein ImpK [Rhodobacter aestuarii]
MAHGDDRDKTVIGGALPPRPDPNQPPRPVVAPNPDDPYALRQPPAQAPQMPGTERTVIGGAFNPPDLAMPGGGQAPHPGAPPNAYPGQASGFPPNDMGAGQSPGENTWLGGGLPAAQPGPGMMPQTPPPSPYPPQNPYPQPSAYPSQPQPSACPSAPPPQQGYGAPQQAGFGTGLGQGMGSPFGAGAAQGFFPDVSTPPVQTQKRVTARISLQQALQAARLGRGSSTNPLIAAATNLLILFGRLRTGLVDMQAMPLMEHVAREIDTFERNVLSAGVGPQEAMVAKYLLCGTADDIVQNLPGADRGVWVQYSMAARFFQTRETGVGFFQEAEKAMQSPLQYANLLELMLTCLSLGFEGQYRTAPNGGMQLAQIRRAIYETLRRVKPRPNEDLSVRWLPVLLGGRRRFGGVPVWAVAGIAAALVVGFFATLSTLINRDGAMAAEALYTLHPTEGKIALDVKTPDKPLVPYVAPTAQSQLERMRGAFAPEIEQGLVDVVLKGDAIAIRVGNLLLFESGKADVKAEFAPLAARIAEEIEKEEGPIKVWGYTDSIPMSGRGRFKTNLELSQARAQAVRDVLAKGLSDPGRISAEGKGEADPIGDNATAEGRAQNRRVEVMIAREGTF